MTKSTNKRIVDLFPLRELPVEKEVGIEIEAEGHGVRFPKDIGWWKTTNDGSLRGESVEWVLKAPCRRVMVRRRLQHLDSAIKRYKAKVVPSDRTGVHVHINAQQMTFWQVINFCCLYLSLEKLLVHYCGPDREGNMFCLRASDAEYLSLSLASCVSQENLRICQSAELRYAAINLSSLSKYGSVEFRSLRTPENLLDIHTWVAMLLKLKDASVNFNHPSEIVESMSGDGPEQFIRNVMGKYTEKLLYPGYEESIWDGIRRIQDIAYAPRMSPSEKAIKKTGYTISSGAGIPAAAWILTDVHTPPSERFAQIRRTRRER